MLGKLIGLVLGAVFVGALAGTAVTAVVNVNTSGWGAPSIALWGVVAICIVAGIIYMVLKEAGIDV
jgi:hypothetical protein